jgi:hypothetical protein
MKAIQCSSAWMRGQCSYDSETDQGPGYKFKICRCGEKWICEYCPCRGGIMTTEKGEQTVADERFQFRNPGLSDVYTFILSMKK